jgi:lysophospholipase L1-like esterase
MLAIVLTLLFAGGSGRAADPAPSKAKKRVVTKVVTKNVTKNVTKAATKHAAKKKKAARKNVHKTPKRNGHAVAPTRSSSTAGSPLHVVPVVLRRAAVKEVTSEMEAPSESFSGARALVPFFELLYRSRQEGAPLHVLQYGDSHTASDDWANAMRQNLQSRFGSGGPGFAFAGRPYRGYRRYDISGNNSSGWVTEGTVGHPGDGRLGLGGVSITAASAGETVTMTTEASVLKLCFLRQPGGGSLEIREDGAPIGMVSTDGDLEAGFFSYQPSAGSHTYTLRTLTADPVRLFGWVSENKTGLTYETLGINGAQAGMLADWDEKVLSAQIIERDPALILLAYGTNEALSPKWDPAEYHAALVKVIGRFRAAAPAASILLVGPPDCSLRSRRGLAAFPHMEDVIRVEKQVARETRSAFWDWRERMGGIGAKKRWVEAGLAQPDYVHFTTAGYQMVGNSLFADLMDEYRRFLAVRDEGTTLESGTTR